jgi:hypothetical protein
MDAILFVTFFTTLILIIFFNEYKKSKKNIEKLNENNEKNDYKNFVKISSLNNLKTEEETPKNKKKIFENEEIENNFKMKEPSKQDSLNDNSDLEIIKEEKNSPIFKTKVYNKISISKISNEDENFSNDFNNISLSENDDEEEFDYKKMFSKFCDFIQKNKILKLSELSKRVKTTNEETLKKLREIEKEEELIGYCNNDIYFYLTQNELKFLNDLFINSKKKKFKNSYLNNLFNEITSKRKLI